MGAWRMVVVVVVVVKQQWQKKAPKPPAAATAPHAYGTATQNTPRHRCAHVTPGTSAAPPLPGFESLLALRPLLLRGGARMGSRHGK